MMSGQGGYGGGGYGGGGYGGSPVVSAAAGSRTGTMGAGATQARGQGCKANQSSISGGIFADGVYS